MGMPEIIVSFREAASTVVSRSSRGIVAMIVADTTKTDSTVRVTSATDLTELFTSANAALISDARNAGASSVIATRAVTNDSSVDMAATLALLSGRIFNWLVYPDAEAADTTAIISWIKAQRAAGKTYKAIVCNADAPECEGIVNFCASGLVRNGAAVSAGAYSAKIAGLIAGTPLNQSATYADLSDLDACDAVANMDAAVNAGKLIVWYDREKVKLGRCVTSAIVGAEHKKKVKLLEGVDLIAQDIRDIFADEYVGKVANSYDNKQVFVAAARAYLEALKGSVLDPYYDITCEIDFDAQAAYLEEKGADITAMTDAEILQANTGSRVFLRIGVKLLDSMEDMTLVIYIDDN